MTHDDLSLLDAGDVDQTPLVDGGAFAPGLRPSIFGVDATGREVTLNSGTRGSIVRVSGLRSAYSIRIGGQVLCIEGVDGGVTTDPALLAKLQGWEF